MKSCFVILPKYFFLTNVAFRFSWHITSKYCSYSINLFEIYRKVMLKTIGEGQEYIPEWQIIEY